MTFELGPIVRSIARQKSTFSLLVLQLASGFTVISCLSLAASWYMGIGDTSSGLAEQDIVSVATQSPALAQGAEARQQAELARIRAVPGVVAAAPVSSSLVDDQWSHPGELRNERGRSSAGWSLQSTSALFDVLALQLVEGSAPAALPPADLQNGAIITRSLRDALFPGGEPALGRVISADDGSSVRVVGVIEDVVMRSPFVPGSARFAIHFTGAPDEREARYLVRVAPGQRKRMLGPIAAALGPEDPARFVRVKPFDSKRARHHLVTYGLVVMLAIFGGTVAVLALLGALAVSSFLVTERTRQIGIRRALGGTRTDIVRYFLVESSLAATLGAGMGLIASAGIFVLMKQVFVGLSFQWRFMALTALSVWLVAITAAIIPARRAARISPSVAAKVS